MTRASISVECKTRPMSFKVESHFAVFRRLTRVSPHLDNRINEFSFSIGGACCRALHCLRISISCPSAKSPGACPSKLYRCPGLEVALSAHVKGSLCLIAARCGGKSLLLAPACSTTRQKIYSDCIGPPRLWSQRQKNK